MLRRSVLIGAAAGFAAAGLSVARPFTIVSNKSGTFVDISPAGNNTGTLFHLGDDQEIVLVGILVANNAFNTTISGGSVVVANNGGIGVASGNDELDPENENIPSNRVFGGGLQALLPFWDDIGNHTGDMYWFQDSQRLIIQFDGVVSKPNGNTATFQVQIFNRKEEPEEPPVAAQMLYFDIEDDDYEGGVGASIGYQENAFVGVEWSFNSAFAVRNDSVLSIVEEGSERPPDYNADGFCNGDDFDVYVDDFADAIPTADFNEDGFVDGGDFDSFVVVFLDGC